VEKVRTLTFDAGGTLLYPWPSVGEIYAERMRVHGMDVNSDDVEAGFQRAMKKLDNEPRSGPQVSDREWWRRVVQLTIEEMPQPDSFDDLFDDLWHTFAEPERWRLYPGTRETLAALADRGYRLVILSNWDSRLRTLLDGLELTHLFDEIIISAEVGIEKPDPAIFEHARDVLTHAAHELLHVGDSVRHDADGATADGWAYRLITHCDDDHDPAASQIGRLHHLLTELSGPLS
jgi:putative hydrolase of the HAD superfamily